MPEPLKSLPIRPLDETALRRTLRAQFASVFGAPATSIPFPDHLILRSGMAVGALTYIDSNGQTRLEKNDENFVHYGLTGVRAANLPVLFDGDLATIDRENGHDFLDYAKGIRQGRTDFIISCRICHPTPDVHLYYHPQGEEYQWAVEHALDNDLDDDMAREVADAYHLGISPHIPFEGDVGALFADAAAAVGARAVIVFGGEQTISVPQYAYSPYVYVGQIHFRKPGVPSNEWLQHPGHLLLDKNYLAELTAFAASRGVTYPLSKQPIPVELHPHLHEVGHQFGWDPKTRTSTIKYLPEPIR